MRSCLPCLARRGRDGKGFLEKWRRFGSRAFLERSVGGRGMGGKRNVRPVVDLELDGKGYVDNMHYGFLATSDKGIKASLTDVLEHIYDYKCT